MSRHSHPRCSRLLRAFCVYLVALMIATSTLAGEKHSVWKTVDDALLRVDDRPVKDWNVYQVGKKNDPLLLQMSGRFLLIEVRNRRIFEIVPAKIEHKGEDLLFDTNDRPAQPLDTADWLVRDVGLAYRFSAKLTDENHTLDLQIPHPLDIRSIH